MLSEYKLCFSCGDQFKEEYIIRVKLAYDQELFRCVGCYKYKDEVPM